MKGSGSRLLHDIGFSLPETKALIPYYSNLICLLAW